MDINKCQCIEKSSVIDLKLALITAKNTFYDRAKELEKTGWVSPQAEIFREKADKFQMLINELGKITCPLRK